MSEQASTVRTTAVLDLGDEPADVLVAAAWAQAAVVSTMRDALSAPIEQVLAAHPERTAVLEQAGLVEPGPDGRCRTPRSGCRTRLPRRPASRRD